MDRTLHRRRAYCHVHGILKFSIQPRRFIRSDKRGASPPISVPPVLWSSARGRGLRIPHELHRAIRNRLAGGVALWPEDVSAKLPLDLIPQLYCRIASPSRGGEKFPIKNALPGDFNQSLSLQVGTVAQSHDPHLLTIRMHPSWCFCSFSPH